MSTRLCLCGITSYSASYATKVLFKDLFGFVTLFLGLSKWCYW